MKVYILGDTHGREDAVDLSVRRAKAEGCNQIIQVGDFGYWPHVPSGQSFMEFCREDLRRPRREALVARRQPREPRSA